MNKNFKKINLLISGMVLAMFLATPAFAQTTGAASKTEKTPALSIAAIISKADKEISQRVKNLSNLLVRLDSIKKIPDAQKSILASSVQNEIDQLTALKTKIDADTGTAIAKTDYQSITKSYRIYALVLPQIRIIAASDRVLTIVDSMKTVGSKVQSRISTLTGAGSANIATLNQLFADFNAKVNNAVTQANAAITEVSQLQPDQGDKTKLQANTAALKDARTKITAATSDFAAARKDIGTIVQDLKKMKSSAANITGNGAVPGAAGNTSQTPQ